MMRKRTGMTLVELLVTLSIALAVAAIVLPTVKTLLLDRRSTQAATLVRNFIESAQSRAIGSNNYVSVVFERVSSIPLDENPDGFYDQADVLINGFTPRRFRSGTAIDPVPPGAPVDTNFVPYNTCVRLSMAERPRPRSHKLLGASWDDPTGPGQIVRMDGTGYPDSPISHPQSGRFYFRITSALNLSTALELETEIVAGNEISFGASKTRYLITQTKVNPTNTNPGFWFTCVSSDSINEENEVSTPSGSPSGGYREFTVHPKPKPISSKVLVLPRGMCVDLSLSGFEEQGRSPGMRDRRARFSSEWLYVSSAPNPHELRPVYIEFSPNGTISRVFANGRDSLAATSVPIQTADNLFLHVGKIDQVKRVVNLADGIGSNLFDERTYIVRVSGKTSTITTAPAAEFQSQAELLGIPLSEITISEALRLTRQSVLGQQLSGQ